MTSWPCAMAWCPWCGDVAAGPAAVAAAAASAAVVILAVQALGPAAGPLVAEPAPTTPVPLDPASTTPAPPTPSLTIEPTQVTVTVPPIEQMISIAEAAASAPLLPETSFLRVQRTEEQFGEDSAYRYYDTYTSADGWTWVLREEDESLWMLENAAADLADVPTEPRALDAYARGLGGNSSADQRVYKVMQEILANPAAGGELRSAALLVLRDVALHPQAPETNKDGEVASPAVTVSEIAGEGEEPPMLRIALEDPTSGPGTTYWITVDATGAFVEEGLLNNSTDRFVSRVQDRSVVESLPEVFVDVLGTERVERDFDE